MDGTSGKRIQRDLPIFLGRYHVPSVFLNAAYDRRHRGATYLSRFAAYVSLIKEAFHDFLTICSTDRQGRESIHDIRGYVEKRPSFLWCALVGFSSAWSLLVRPEWARICVYEKILIESVTTCACNYSLRPKPTKRLRALAYLMGIRVLPVYRVFIVHAHISYTHIHTRARSARPIDP